MAWKNAKQGVRRKALAAMTSDQAEEGKSILEFGAFSSPMFDPGEGDTYYADRLSTEELRATVPDPAKRAAIVSVDFVVDAAFDTQIDRRFDLVVANHVIEHVPDAVGWLDRIGRILNPGGHIFLAVPDKNFTFDIMREPTLVRELIDSYVQKRAQPSLASVVDAAYFRRDIRNGSDVWSGQAHRIINRPPEVDVDRLMAGAGARIAEGEYIDTHCNVFTEASFTEAFRTLEVMGIGDLKLVATRPVERPYNEFYALFRKP